MGSPPRPECFSPLMAEYELTWSPDEQGYYFECRTRHNLQKMTAPGLSPLGRRGVVRGRSTAVGQSQIGCLDEALGRQMRISGGHGDRGVAQKLTYLVEATPLTDEPGGVRVSQLMEA